MIIVQEKKDKNIIEENGNFETNNITFSQNKIAKMFMIVLKGYSDPISSIVRELTSNCMDSHTEAKVDTPVIVTMDYDDSGKYISFEDNGAGISVDRFNTIYRKLLESTKENSNDELGGFGLGSKTPLAYREDFYLTTRFDGIEYSYIVFMNDETGCPDTTLLYEKPTDLGNGTIVKVYIEEEDEYKFINACQEQLIYFDNVIFKGNLSYRLTNDYKILDSDYYKYRPDNELLKTLHICIEKVVYPLNLSKLGKLEYKGIEIDKIDLPFALKFKTGDLKVTPTREQIEYNKDNIAKLKAKIYSFLDNFIKYIENNHSNVFNGNFIEYTKLLNESGKSKVISLYEGYQIEISQYNFLHKFISDTKWHKTAHLPIKLNYSSCVNLLHINYKVNLGQIPVKDTIGGYNYNARQLYNRTTRNNYLYKGTIEDDTKFKDKIKAEYVDTADIYKLAKLDFDDYRRWLHIKKEDLGIAKTISEFYKIMCNELPSWEDLKVPQEYIDDYNERHRRGRRTPTTTVKRENHIIPVRDILQDKAYDMNTIKDIPNFKGYLIYGDITEKQELLTMGNVMKDIIYSKLNWDNDKRDIERKEKSWNKVKNKAIKVIRIAKGNYKHFKGMNKNTIHVKLLDSVENELLMDRVIANILYSNNNKKIFYEQDIIDKIEKINVNIADKLQELRNFVRRTDVDDVDGFISDFIIRNKNCKELTDNYYIKLFQEVEKYFGELIHLINYNTSTEAIAKLLHQQGKRINNDFYLKPKEERERIPTKLPKKVSIFVNSSENQITRFPTREELMYNYYHLDNKQLTA